MSEQISSECRHLSKSFAVNTAANLWFDGRMSLPNCLDTEAISKTVVVVIGMSLISKRTYRGMKSLHETLKILPQKPVSMVTAQIAEHLGRIWAIHHSSKTADQSLMLGKCLVSCTWSFPLEICQFSQYLSASFRNSHALPSSGSYTKPCYRHLFPYMLSLRLFLKI